MINDCGMRYHAPPPLPPTESTYYRLEAHEVGTELGRLVIHPVRLRQQPRHQVSREPQRVLESFVQPDGAVDEMPDAARQVRILSGTEGTKITQHRNTNNTVGGRDNRGGGRGTLAAWVGEGQLLSGT